ncbi:DUF4274 domain-containing protein [Acidovorax sp. LjRoot66]|uniref:DUF4274 domain-containing protein n=1 Tax=Acidovorax sp. LjRoot66 TaxID=3342334 RepID=UPI003ECFE88B
MISDNDIEARAWNLVHAYLADASPAAWHVFAARSNYDGNKQALRWLLDQPTLDRGTALLIYWYLGAAWHVQFTSADQALSPETFTLLRLIEERYAEGFYQAGNIWFDPHTSEGGRPDDYPKVPVVRPVPAIMLEPVNGSELVEVSEDPEGFDEGLPLSVAVALYALFEENED